VVITANPGEPYPPDAYRSGQRAVTVSFPRNDLSPLVRLKSLNCLENVLGRREAAAGGADEGIFFNTRGDLAEGTASNVFLLFEDGRLVTPPAASGLLPGIAREIVLSVAKDLGLQAVVRTVSRRDIENAREVWLTNSLIEVMPLVSLDGVPVGEGRPGEFASRARQACREYMRRLRN
jgi:branched-subunit amino acid aminotransferase/4-amino-4-deoxychorismate lyase